MNPELLTRLGYKPAPDGMVDRASVRRAYAVALKKIDAEADPEAFQLLREAYEEALQWLARQDASADVAAPVPAESDSGAQSAQHAGIDGAGDRADSPRQVASVVASRLVIASCARLHAASAALVASEQRYHEEEWQHLLHACLAHPDLLNFEARDMFEKSVVKQLAAGWQPGHDMLFAAACDVFEWRKNPEQLVHHGALGIFLLAAMDEGDWFRWQPAPVRGAQQKVIERLRRAAPPDSAQLFRSMRAFELMLAHFPAWTAVTLDPLKIAQWRELYQERNGSPYVMRPDDASGTQSRRHQSRSDIDALRIAAALSFGIYMLSRLWY